MMGETLAKGLMYSIANLRLKNGRVEEYINVKCSEKVKLMHPPKWEQLGR